MSLTLMKTVMDNDIHQSHGCVLVVSNSDKTIASVDEKLLQQGYDVVAASESELALSLFELNRIDLVMLAVDHIDVSINKLIFSLHTYSCGAFIPVIALLPAEDEKLLAECTLAGCDDFLFTPLTATALKARLSSLEQLRELKELHKRLVNEQIVARQILAFALFERTIQFEEIQLLSKSKEIFSGDLFLTAKRPDGGLYILLADFTGHGLSAAIGTLPVADIFSVMTSKGFELESILENINNKLHTLLPVTMFMACSVLKIHADLKHASVWNGGMPDIYLRNSQNGDIKNKIKASHIPLGIDRITSKNFQLKTISINHKDQFIIYSDGLTEAENASGDMFGYQNLDQCLANSREKEFVFANIVEQFADFCGDIEPNDDVTLACIPCTGNMTEIKEAVPVSDRETAFNCNNDWVGS